MALSPLSSGPGPRWPCPPRVIYHGPGGEPLGLQAPVSPCNCLFVAPSKQVSDQQKSIKAWWASQPIGFGSLSCSPCCSESSLCRRRSLTQIPTRLMIFSSHLGLILSFSLPLFLFSPLILSFFLFNLFLQLLYLLISRFSSSGLLLPSSLSLLPQSMLTICIFTV